MEIPTKLISSTIDEFKAIGYTCRVCSSTVDIRGDNKTAEVVKLAFEKLEEEKDES